MSRISFPIVAARNTAVELKRLDRFMCEMANLPDYDKSVDGTNAVRGADGILNIEMPARVNDAWNRVLRIFPDLFPTRGNPDDQRTIHDNQFGGSEFERLSPWGLDPGMAWVDPADPDAGVALNDIPPKLRAAWLMPSPLARRLFLTCELAYYLRSGGMLAAAQGANAVGMAKRRAAELAGEGHERAIYAGLEAYSEALRSEETDFRRLWSVDELDSFAHVLLRAIDVSDRMCRCPDPDCPAPYFIAQRRSQRYCSEACAQPAQRELKRRWWREHGGAWRRARRKRRTSGSARRGVR